MTETTPYDPPRDWIPAAASFAAQPTALRAMVRSLPAQLAGLPPRPRRLMIAAIGASHAATATPLHVLRGDGIDATRHLPGELIGGTSAADVLLAISQSGRSAEVVDLASRSTASSLVALTNYARSPLGTRASLDITLGDHSDSSVSFLSFTGTIMALSMIADHWAGRWIDGRWDDVADATEEVAAVARPVLEGMVEEIVSRSSVDVVAPTAVLSAAEEAALMLREGPRIPATAMETRLYLHGPMDVAGDTAHVVIGGARESTLVDQLVERTTTVLFVTGRGGPRPTTSRARVVELPIDANDGPAFSIAASVVAQLLTLLSSDAVHVDIDEPAFTRLDTKTAFPESR
ncbi:sugar isomerase [Labedella phragmitis]|uniref:Sugar isomerase n=1 Tax=Labedella phragmitis TaxID=2498849 RepID=A0A444PPM2_9MICO|nr:sugar isomerase [Labedella phragmitis]RWZ46300.1 sugar isomerase [Labedella phragmitis]